MEKAKRLSTEFYSSTLPPVLRQLEKKLHRHKFFCGDKVNKQYLGYVRTRQRNAASVLRCCWLSVGHTYNPMELYPLDVASYKQRCLYTSSVPTETV